MIATKVSISSSIAKCIPALRGVSFILTGDRQRADDIAEKAIIWLFDNLPAALPEQELKVRMLSILHDLYYVGGHKSRKAKSATGKVRGMELAASIHQDSLAFDQFRMAFCQLRDNEREVLILEEACGLSATEVAKICGCKISAIDIRVLRARQKLTRILYENDWNWLPSSDVPFLQ